MTSRISTRKFCGSTRSLEILLMMFSIWAGAVTFISHFVPHDSSSHIYMSVIARVPGWEIGLITLALVTLQGVGVALHPCPNERSMDPSYRPRSSDYIASLLRQIGAMFELGLFAFLAVCYIQTWAVNGLTNLASGLCFIIAGLASVVSYCISRERARMRAKEGIHLSKQI